MEPIDPNDDPDVVPATCVDELGWWRAYLVERGMSTDKVDELLAEDDGPDSESLRGAPDR